MVTDTYNTFTLDVRAFLESIKTPVSIKKALKTKNSQIKLSILADIALLTKYIPALKQIFDTGKKLSYDFSKFGQIFLHISPLLRSLGITIILPKSLQKIVRPKLRLDVSAQENTNYNRESFMQLDQLLTFDWQIAIGDKKLSITEFKKLLKESRGLVKIMDEFVLLDEKKMKTLLKKLDTLPEHLHQAELMQAALANSLLDVDVHLDGQLTTLFNTLTSYQTVPIPANIRADLRPYQERGFSWLIENIETAFGSIIADDMGLGKTLQVITAIQYCKNSGLLMQDKVLELIRKLIKD